MSSYKCSECDQVSNNKQNMEKHISNVCPKAHLISDIVKLVCDICSKEYDTEKSLKQHKQKCFKKRAMPVTEYKDVDLVKRWSDDINLIVKDFFKRIEILEEENKELKKRLDRIDGSGKEKVEEEEEESDEPCQLFKLIKFIPTSRDQVKSVLKDNEIEDMKYIVVTVNGQRSLELRGIVTKEGIEVGDVVYYYNPTKKEKSSSDLKVIIKKYCLNSAKAGHEYCKEHCK